MAVRDEELRLNMVVNGNPAQKAIGDLETANRKLKNSNDDLRKAKQRLIAEGKKETEEYKKITAEMKQNSQEIKENKAKMADLRKELGLTGLTIKQLRKEQSRLKNLLASTTPNTEAYKQYEKQLQAVTGRLNQLNGRAKNTGGIIGKMKSSFGGIKALAAGAFGIGALLNFTNKVVDSVNQLKKVKSTLQQITGLKGLQLEAASAGIKGLSDAYEKDTKQMSEAVHNFSQGMEIDFNSALDLVKKGFLDGADANEEFLDKLREYPVLLNEAGFSADEAIALMTQEVKSGIYSDKGVDAIKEANLRLREMTPAAQQALEAIGISSDKVQEELTNGSKTTFNVMQQVSEKLSELPPQSAEVGQAIADIFGGPGEDAGYKYLANLQNINLETSKLTDSSNEYLKAKKLEIEANEAMNLVWLKLTGTGSSLNQFYSKLKLGVAQLLGGQKDLTTQFEDQADKVINLNKELVPLTEEYDELKSKSELSKNEQNRLKTVISEIATITPTAITAFDEYGNALDISSDKARDFIDTQQALLKFRNKEAIEEQTDALADYRREIDELNAQLSRTDKDGNVIKSVQTYRGSESQKLSGDEIAERQARLAELQQLEAGALESVNQLSGDYLDKYIKRQQDQTKATLEETKKRADALGLEYSDDVTEEVLSAMILKYQRLANASKEDREKELNRQKSAEESKAKAFEVAETQLNAIITKLRKQREIDAQKGLDKELAKIDEKYRLDLEKAAGHEDQLKQLQDLKAKEKADAKLLHEQQLAQRIQELKDANRLEQEALAFEREIANATTDEEKTQLLLEKTQAIANAQIEIEETKALELLRINNATEEEIAAVKQKFDLQRQKAEAAFIKGKEAADKKAVENEKTLNRQRTQEYANMFGGIAKLLGEHTQAGKAAAVAQATMNTYQGITQVWKSESVLPEPFATAAKIVSTATVLASGLSAVKQIESTKTPGYQDGYYPITRTDGKKFNARVKNKSNTQLVTEPTYFGDANILTGEGGPEIIIDTPTLKNLDPEVVRNIYATAARTRGYETGLYQQPFNNANVTKTTTFNQDFEETTTNTTNDAILEAVGLLINKIENLKLNYTLEDERERRALEAKLQETQLQSKN